MPRYQIKVVLSTAPLSDKLPVAAQALHGDRTAGAGILEGGRGVPERRYLGLLYHI